VLKIASEVTRFRAKSSSVSMGSGGSNSKLARQLSLSLRFARLELRPRSADRDPS